MAIATLEEYLREFSVEIGDRILTASRSPRPGEPVSPILGKLLRKPFAARRSQIAGAVKRLQQANSVAIIAEMGTARRSWPWPSLTYLQRDARTLVSSSYRRNCFRRRPRDSADNPGARTYVIDSLRSLRPGQSGPQGVNELRLRNGRIVRDGVHTTLTDMRLRANTNPLGTVGLPSTARTAFRHLRPR